MFSRLKTSTGGIDQNDMEDGLLCLHLNPFRSWTLVTADDGTRTALSETLEAFEATDPKGPLMFGVIDSKEFIERLEAQLS